MDKQRQTLLSLYGVGPASVGYILFNVFHWWDELSYISPREQKIYCSLLHTPTMRSRDGVLPASHLLSSKMQGNEVEAGNTPTVRSWEVYSKLFFDKELTEPVPVRELIDYFERRFSGYKMFTVHYIWEDLFWKRKHENVPWLESLIRL